MNQPSFFRVTPLILNHQRQIHHGHEQEVQKRQNIKHSKISYKASRITTKPSDGLCYPKILCPKPKKSPFNNSPNSEKGNSEDKSMSLMKNDDDEESKAIFADIDNYFSEISSLLKSDEFKSTFGSIEIPENLVEI